MQAKVAAVEGKYIRVHYKVSSFSWLQSYKCRTAISTIFYRVFSQGESADNDEWLPVNSKELRQRIVAVEPPAPKSKDSSSI